MTSLSRRALIATAAALPVAGFAGPLVVRAKRKPQDEWTPYPSRGLDTLAIEHKTVALGGGFGGRRDGRQKATGFFRAAEVDGRWWIVDPEGYRCLAVGVVSVTPGRSKRNTAALKEKFGSEAKWAEQTTGLLRSRGFNCTGNWSSVDALRAVERPLPYTVNLNFMGTFGRKLDVVHQQSGHLGYPNDAFPVFHPGFEPFCDEYARAGSARKADPYLTGYFSDNELPAPQDLIDKTLKLDAVNDRFAPGVKAAREWMAARKSPSATVSDLTAEDRDAFRGFVYDRYMQLTTRALRKHDSNHLCLGPRFHGSSLRSAAIWKAAGAHLDVIAANVYWQWSPDVEMLAMWRKQAAKPFMVTEFYAKGDDAGFANSSGAGWIVPSQKDRALFYQNFTLGLLESKLCTGWHWFKYMDNDPEDLTTDPSNRDSNKGIVTIDYKPYDSLLDGMEPLNRSVYAAVDWFDRRT